MVEDDGLDLKRFSDLSSAPFTYRIEPMLPMHGNMMLSGYAKLGKTSLIMHLMRALITDHDFLGRPCEQVDGSIVYLNFEMPEQFLRKYAKDAKLKLSHDQLYVSDYRGRAGDFWEMLVTMGGADELSKTLTDVECSVLIVDPISVLISMSGNSSQNNDEVREVLETLGSMAAKARLDHLIIVDHTGHGAKDRARGASAKMDWPDVIWNLQKAGDDSGRRLDVIGRAAWGEANYHMDADGQLEPSSAPHTSIDKVRQQLALAGMTGTTVNEIVEATGIPRSTVQKDMNKLEKQGDAKRDGRIVHSDRWVYQGSRAVNND